MGLRIQVCFVELDFFLQTMKKYILGFCVAILCVPSSFAIILTRKKELVTLPLFSSLCLMTVSPHGVMGWPAVCDLGIS